MSPILGIIASSKLAAAGDFESIATVTVGSGGAANVEFTSIPSTYTHLQIRAIARSTYASGGDYAQMTFNGTGGTSYATHYLYGNGTSAAAAALTSSGFIYLDFLSSDNKTASSYTAYVIDILDYANTNKNKTVRWLGGEDLNGSGEVFLMSGLYNNTSAISSIKFVPNTGPNFKQYSHFALYGIKSA